MRLAFVIQRYGNEINGGAEYHCRQIVERLAKNHEISVLTTCAQDYVTWKNEYPSGDCEVNGVPVRRFAVDFTRQAITFNKTYDFLVEWHRWKRWHDVECPTPLSNLLLRLLWPFSPNYYTVKSNVFNHIAILMQEWLNERFWMRMQGPFSTKLQSYLKENEEKYDAFFFFSYNYASTFYGLPLVKKRAALIPTLHEEECARFFLYRKLFRSPRYLLFNSEEEQSLAAEVFPNVRDLPQDVVGVGIDIAPPAERALLQQRFDVHDPFILYLGRVEPSKGCPLLFDSFIKYKASRPGPLKLLVIGKAEMPIPEHPDIRALGFVDAEVKAAALQHAKVLVMPSYYESLSLAVLEAWAAKTPVMVHGLSNVLVGHCRKSGGGLSFTDGESFAQTLDELLTQEERLRQLAEGGFSYVQQNYTWDLVLSKYDRVIDYLTER